MLRLTYLVGRGRDGNKGRGEKKGVYFSSQETLPDEEAYGIVVAFFSLSFFLSPPPSSRLSILVIFIQEFARESVAVETLEEKNDVKKKEPLIKTRVHIPAPPSRRLANMPSQRHNITRNHL